jgi:hypothetical protein
LNRKAFADSTSLSRRQRIGYNTGLSVGATGPVESQKGKMKYMVILEESEEGFAASVPYLPGCHSQGATEQEALENKHVIMTNGARIIVIPGTIR